jgi:hypothetical protein
MHSIREPLLEGKALYNRGRHRTIDLLIKRACFAKMKNIFSVDLDKQVQGGQQYQGIMKGEVSLYCWPLFDWFGIFLFTKQTNPNESNRRAMVQ